MCSFSRLPSYGCTQLVRSWTRLWSRFLTSGDHIEVTPLNLTRTEIQEGAPGGKFRSRKGKADLELLVGGGMKEINALKEACRIERVGSP
jgi:hypothetical protein